jgi:glycerate kinase
MDDMFRHGNKTPLSFLLAPDSFKDSLSASDVCAAMRQGILQVIPDARILSLPLSDGGEGFVDSMILASGGKKVAVNVTGPLGNSVMAFYGLMGKKHDIAIVEMAAASGLQQVPLHLRNPLKTTTFGTGELIFHALNHSVRTLIIGIGGSATHDVACGTAQALGARFFDSNGRILDQKMNGASLPKVNHIDLSSMTSRLKGVKIQVACDVKNPLLGSHGAARTYARQKGANEHQIGVLESGTRHIINLIESVTRIRVRDIPGSGAAGGMGAGLMAFLGAKLLPGVHLFLKYSDIAQQLQDVDYILTGEGKTDDQTRYGKTIWGIVEIAEKNQIPVIIISGQIKKTNLLRNRVHSMISLSREAGSIDRSLEKPAFWLEKAAGVIARRIKAEHSHSRTE